MAFQPLSTAWSVRGEPLDVPGAATRIWREGSGEVVVCLHGVPSSAFLYRKVLTELARSGVEGVAFDFPGLGLAERPRHFDYSWTGLAKWLLQALDAAAIDRFHLVVHDIGGPIGFEAIRRLESIAPERVRSLTILNSMLHVASFRRPWPMAPFAWPGIGWLWLQGMRTPMWVPMMRLMGVHDGPTKDEIRAYRELLFREDGGRAFLRIMRSFERTGEFEERVVAALKQRDFPVQVIWGAEDPALKAEKYAQGICETLRLPHWHSVRGKHFLQEDSPEEIAGRIAMFVHNES